MKKILLLILIATLISCETKEDKAERLHIDMVFKSERYLKGIEDWLMLSASVKSAKDNVLNSKEVIEEYNGKLGYVLGYSDNLDTIDNYLKNKKGDYFMYLQKEAFWRHSRDSLEMVKYKNEKDSILKSLQND